MSTYQPSTILIDKYRIEALLGQGAFGEVYRVTHLGLNVTRALKVLRRDAPGIGSTEFNDGQARFRLEAQLGAQLNSPSPHPNLLQIHNFEKAGDLLALEMEYAPGGSLLERLSKAREQGQPISIEEALQIALDVASGLAALHARDIVHRDIKPSNILFDGKGRAKLADLGLAQIPGGPSLRSQLSNPLPHPGTPGYMSPEQENSRGILKPPSDVYALGLVLFEMLTGRNYSLLRPGTAGSNLRGDIPTLVDELLKRMLAENYRERPWNGDETVRLLRKVLDELKNGQMVREKAAEQARLKAQADANEKARQAARVSAQTNEDIHRNTEETRFDPKRFTEKLFFRFRSVTLFIVGLVAVVFTLFIVGSVAAVWVGSLFLNHPVATVTPASTMADMAGVIEQPTVASLKTTEQPTAIQTSSPSKTPRPSQTFMPTNTPPALTPVLTLTPFPAISTELYVDNFVSLPITVYLEGPTNRTLGIVAALPSNSNMAQGHYTITEGTYKYRITAEGKSDIVGTITFVDNFNMLYVYSNPFHAECTDCILK